MDGRFAKKHRRVTHDFAFSGLIACGHCGCSVVGEIKKQRYVYYHCTGYADKCQGNPAPAAASMCARKCSKQQFTELLGRLNFDDEVLEWVREALHASHADERREHEEAIKRLQAEYKRLQRPHPRHVRRQARWARSTASSSSECRTNGARSRIAASARSNGTRRPTSPIWKKGVQILELARNAQRLFEKQEPREKRRLLNFLAIELLLGGRRAEYSFAPTV